MINSNSINNLLDMFLKSGIDKALDGVMDKSYCKVLDRDINKLRHKLEDIMSEDDGVKKFFVDYLFKVSELDKYKEEAIYIQGILDAIEVYTLFNKYKY